MLKTAEIKIILKQGNFWFKIELYYLCKSFVKILKKTVFSVFPWFVEREHDRKGCERSHTYNSKKALDVKIALRREYIEKQFCHCSSKFQRNIRAGVLL